MKAKTFKTFNGLLIYVPVEGDRVCVVGTQEKEVLVSLDKKAVTRHFKSLVVHYEERAKTEA